MIPISGIIPRMAGSNKVPGGTAWTLFLGGALQLALAYLGPLILTVVLSGLFSAPDDTVWQVIDYLIFGVFGIGAAVLISCLISKATDSGRWIWMMPVLLLIFGLLWDMRLGAPDSAQIIFFGTGEGGWIKLFVTLPAWSCCLYSLTMSWRRRRRNRRHVDSSGEC